MNQQEKVELLRGYLRRRPDIRTLVETGLWNGRGSGMGVLDLIDEYYVIDIDQENVERADQFLIEQGFPLRFIYCGDSAVWMRRILTTIEQSALFWLDAHRLSEYDGEDSCPLLAELAAIVGWEHGPRSVIVIDDVRLFSDRGNDYFPSMEQVRGAVAGVGYLVESHDDVIAFMS